MSRLSRITQLIFAGSATNNGVFGSAQLGTPTTTTNIATIMGGAAWLQGWLSATLGASKFPALEEFQGVEYVTTSQLAYLFQQGIPEYDAGTTYYIGSIVTNPGTFQIYGSLTNANVGNALSSGANWQLLADLTGGSRLKLSVNSNFYVATTGNDSNPGTSGSPWLTIQHAVNYIQNNIDLNGYNAAIVVADGTYTGAVLVSGPFTGAGSVQLIGNTTTPANCIISTTGASCITANNNAVINVSGFKLTTATSGNGIFAASGAIINITGNMNYGAISGTAYHILANGAEINITGNYTVSGAAIGHIAAQYSGARIIYSASVTVTITGTPAFSKAFAVVDTLGMIYAVSDTFSGSATGVRYAASANGVIDTVGGGATYFPGNSSGTTATGGQYI